MAAAGGGGGGPKLTKSDQALSFDKVVLPHACQFDVPWFSRHTLKYPAVSVVGTVSVNTFESLPDAIDNVLLGEKSACAARLLATFGDDA